MDIIENICNRICRSFNDPYFELWIISVQIFLYKNVFLLERLNWANVNQLEEIFFRRYIPEEKTFHNHRCENLKSYWAN
jgi:hypothetical protein